MRTVGTSRAWERRFSETCTSALVAQRDAHVESAGPAVLARAALPGGAPKPCHAALRP
ncbi:protein of unknown function [Paraburkholderia kururiensis]